MKNSLRRLIFVAGVVALGACNQADATPNAELERDLEQTRLSEFELANRNAKRTDVVSAAERIPTSERMPTRRAPTLTPNKAPVEKAPAVTSRDPSIDTSVTAPRPRATPQTQPARRGPYKTVGEIIREAPFPINP